MVLGGTAHPRHAPDGVEKKRQKNCLNGWCQHLATQLSQHIAGGRGWRARHGSSRLTSNFLRFERFDIWKSESSGAAESKHFAFLLANDLITGRAGFPQSRQQRQSSTDQAAKTSQRRRGSSG